MSSIVRAANVAEYLVGNHSSMSAESRLLVRRTVIGEIAESVFDSVIEKSGVGEPYFSLQFRRSPNDKNLTEIKLLSSYENTLQEGNQQEQIDQRTKIKCLFNRAKFELWPREITVESYLEESIGELFTSTGVGRPSSIQDIVEGVMKKSMKFLSDIKGTSPVFFIGKTGVGKSTLTNQLCGCTMLSIPRCKIEKTESSTPAIVAVRPYTEIGLNQYRSQTTDPYVISPEISFMGGWVICDCPGSGDSRGDQREICNAISIVKAISNARSIKGFVVCVTASDITDKSNGGLLCSLKYLQKLLKTFDSYSASVLFVITRSTREDSLENLVVELREGIRNYSTDETVDLDLRTFCEQILQSNCLSKTVLSNPLDGDNKRGIIDTVSAFPEVPLQGSSDQIEQRFGYPISEKALRGMRQVSDALRFRVSAVLNQLELDIGKYWEGQKDGKTIQELLNLVDNEMNTKWLMPQLEILHPSNLDAVSESFGYQKVAGRHLAELNHIVTLSDSLSKISGGTITRILEDVELQERSSRIMNGLKNIRQTIFDQTAKLVTESVVSSLGELESGLVASLFAKTKGFTVQQLLDFCNEIEELIRPNFQITLTLISSNPSIFSEPHATSVAANLNFWSLCRQTDEIEVNGAIIALCSVISGRLRDGLGDIKSKSRQQIYDELKNSLKETLESYEVQRQLDAITSYPTYLNRSRDARSLVAFLKTLNQGLPHLDTIEAVLDHNPAYIEGLNNEITGRLIYRPIDTTDNVGQRTITSDLKKIALSTMLSRIGSSAVHTLRIIGDDTIYFDRSLGEDIFRNVSWISIEAKRIVVVSGPTFYQIQPQMNLNEMIMRSERGILLTGELVGNFSYNKVEDTVIANVIQDFKSLKKRFYHSWVKHR